jgi:cbb3-type cytochrome oxidase subunit 1
MSVVYFTLAAVLGFVLLLWPGESGYYAPVHAHLNLLGFMSMMIYGVGYHILPRFSGRHIYSTRLMNVQFWFANAGIIGMSISWPFVMSDNKTVLFNPVLLISGLFSVIAILFFTINILKTIKSAQ